MLPFAHPHIRSRCYAAASNRTHERYGSRKRSEAVAQAIACAVSAQQRSCGGKEAHDADLRPWRNGRDARSPARRRRRNRGSGGSRIASCRSAKPRSAPFPDWLDKRLVRGLHAQGIEMLYTHQAEALDALRAGKDIVVVTPTASGKIAVLRPAGPPGGRRGPRCPRPVPLPTKALSQDQLAAFRELADVAEMDVEAGVYDGDTPGAIRTNIRTSGQVVVTNPDMLHSAILPHHTKWFQLFEQLRYIVVDETHTYRGIFGSHVANVLTRLLRLCEHYGSKPQIVCCSATIGNPKELAETLTGRQMTGHRPQRRSGRREARGHPEPADHRRAPAAFDRVRSASRTHGPRLPARRPPDDRLLKARVAVELLLTSLREAFREGRGPLKRIRGYRGGYLPTERRGIEAGLRSGEVLGVVSHQRAGARDRYRSAGRVDPRRLPGHHRRPPGSRWVAPVGDGKRAWPSWLRGRARSTSTSPTIPSTSSTRRPKRRASIRPTCTSCWPTSGRPLSRCRSRAAIPSRGAN